MKKLRQFEDQHGGDRIRALKKTIDAVASRRESVEVLIPGASNSIAFGVIADTHYGSLYEAKDQVSAFYSRCEDEGIKDVLHAGDILDGHHVYRGQEFETHKIGWQRQRDWFAQVAPKCKGITTHFVTGNHDASLKKAAGIDVGEELQHVRPDWRFLGEDIGRVTFKLSGDLSYTVMLLHPGGGSAYAISYKIQKIIEQLEGGTKPDMICNGHFHKAELLPSYRNIAGVQAGAFQWQTPFMVQKGLSAHVGGWIIRASVGTQSKSMRAEFVSFWK